MFTPWKCGDCGAHGKIRHDPIHTAADIARWTSKQHAVKSPACHQKATQTQDALARLNPRDRHILLTARIKRKLMADALRIQRNAGREAAENMWCDRWNLIRATLTREERLMAWNAAVDVTRKRWTEGKATRKGYAFT